VKNIFSNKNYIVLVIAMSFFIGSTGAFNATIELITKPFGYNPVN
jgi:hypothetical protein